MSAIKESVSTENKVFSGNILIFHAFDIGDDVDLEKIQELDILFPQNINLPKYFKLYHAPLSIELPRPHRSSNYFSARLHSFGVVSLGYKISFKTSLDELRKELNDIDASFQEKSVEDLNAIFNVIKPYVKQPKLFHMRDSYLVIQVNPDPEIDVAKLKEKYSSLIASMVRFETELLSEYQKNEILESSMGYYRGDFVVVDSEAAFIYDAEYEELLDFFEFANIQRLELEFFDKILDDQLNIVYERRVKALPLKVYLPFIGMKTSHIVDDLERLKVDISVIIERLESSIKFAGEAYYSELYDLLVDKLDIVALKESVQNKMSIVKDIRMVYKNRTNIIREDLISVLIIALIFIELVVGVLDYFK